MADAGNTNGSVLDKPAEPINDSVRPIDRAADQPKSHDQLVKRGRGRPKGSKNKQSIAIDDQPISSARQGPGRPRKEAARLVTEVQQLDGPAHVEPAVNPDRPLAPIFLPRSQQAPAPALEEPLRLHTGSLTNSFDEVANPNDVEVEAFILPQHNPSHRVEESLDEDESDDYIGLTPDDYDGIQGDAAEAEGDFDDSNEGSGQLPMLVLDAFQKQLQYLKKMTEGRGPAARHPVYDILQSFWLPRPDHFFALRQMSLLPEQLLTPRFFYWDPLLLVDRIPCPAVLSSATGDIHCGGILVRHGYCEAPRRIIDLENSYYLIYVRYRCNQCRPVRTFSSCSPLVMAKLPKPLAAQFPAYLTKRSGLSKQVFAIMHCCFQNSLGGKQFADSLNVLHRRFHEMLEVQYLQTVLERGTGESEPFPSFESGPSAAPSGKYCRDLYDREIEAHEKEFDQHTAMRSCRGMGIDHSHKITKQIAKIKGEPVFTGLLTMTNEYGEIRICDLVPTKAHSAFDGSLIQMNHSIELFGLEPPRIIFTDNLADKPMLERHFPSLKEGVRPVDSFGDLPVLQLPPGCVPKICQTATQINSAIFSLIDLFSNHDGDTFAVGLDTEWDVDLTARREGVPDRRTTAVMQIAYGEELSEHISSGGLPAQLLTFLQNPQVLKVGRNVLLDLKNLQEDSGSTIPFCGGVDLGRLAKEKNIVTDARASLGELCRKTLSAILPKDLHVCVTPTWSNPSLTDEQIEYAALDAYASLKIYEKLNILQVPTPVNFNNPLPPDLDVFIFHDDRTTIIARGIISPDKFNSFEGISLTKTRILIKVLEVYVPGAKNRLHRDQNLSSFGQTPFNMVCRKTQIKTFVEGFVPAHISTLEATIPDSNLNQPYLDPLAELPTDPLSPFPAENPDFENLNISFSEVNAVPVTHPSSNLATGEMDSKAAEDYAKLLHDLTAVPWAPAIRSGVLKDIFHVFHMIYIPKTHGLRVTFSRALRDAIFLPDAEDKKRIVSYLASQDPPMTWDECLQSNPKFIKRHCKHVVPPPEQLYGLVSKVFEVYGPLKDAQSGLPLFSPNTWKTVKNILEIIKLGQISDPPGIPLYYCIGTAHNGLPIYRCWRGTNFTEGAVHRPIRKSMPYSGVSPRHTANRLKDFVFRHNMLVGTYNTTGQHYRGHFDLWLINERQSLLNSEAIRRLIPKSQPVARWVNGDLYTQTTEVFGILPVPDPVQVASGILNYDSHLKPEQYPYLASKQNTRYAVLTLHTTEEKKLFSTFMRTEPVFMREGGPDWPPAVKKWNEHSDGKYIFYKLVEHLKSYYTTWMSTLNAKHTRISTYSTRKQIDNIIRNPARLTHAPSVPQYSSPDRPLPTRGLREIEHEGGAPLQETGSRIQLAGTSQHTTIVQKRPAEVAGGEEVQGGGSRKRARRQCAKCGRGDGCQGSSGKARCRFPCRDCGELECEGRSSRNRNKKCPNS